jgi:hypothetical protein
MASVTTPPDAAIEPLLRLLARVRREARAWVWIESLAVLAIAAAAIFWTTLALDWLIEPPAWTRGVAVAGAVAAILWLVATRLVSRLATPLPDRALALAVERRNPQCGDTLSTAISLAAAAAEPVDAELADHTTAAAAALARDVSARNVFRRGRLVTVALAGLAAAASVAGFALARPDLAGIWARRLARFEDVPWPRRVQLAAEGFVGGVLKAARGGDVDLLVRATATGPLPELVELRSRTAGGGWRTVRMGTRGGADDDEQIFGHLLEAVGDDLEIEIRGGDARLRGLRLDVVEPPAVAAATIRTTLPDYLGGGRRELPASRLVPVPRGSRVEVSLRATKPLASATLVGRFAGAEGEETLATIQPPSPPTDTIAATIPLLDGDCTLAASFTDTDGITNREPITLALTAVPDEPPRLALRLADISAAVTPAARLPIVGTIADDHGLADASVSLARVGQATPGSVPVRRVRGGEPLLEIPADRPELVLLEPLGLAVGDRLTVAVTARDRCTLAGGPNIGAGETWTLDVVSPESLQAMLEAREVLLRRRFEAAIEDLTLARRGLDEPTAPGDERLASGRLGEATARCGGETGEIAAAFRGIRGELANNGLLTPELETRLVGQIAAPLVAVVEGPLAALAEGCRGAAAGELEPADLAARADAALAALRAVLARMLELESFTEVVERLRGVIETQERIRRDTLERQRERARELLE